MTIGLNSLRAALAALVLAAFALPASAQIPASERQVLVNLYNSTNGDNWRGNDGWLGPVGTECSWVGVYCDANGDHVVEVHMYLNNLVGTLPSLSGLTLLQSFDAVDNHLTGSIPSLSDLTSLQSFDVRRNQMTGPIPSLSGLTSLQHFHAYSNHLTGSIPPLSGLISLQSFSVYDNQLTGSIPSLSNLPSLLSFYVGKNRLSGTPPPTPPSLVGGFPSATLCPNALHPPSPTDADWDAATGESPWWQNCDPVFADGFEP